MRELAHIAMLSVIPVTLLLFLFIRPRRAVIVVFLGGWLFLPQLGYTISGLPNYNRLSAMSLAIILAVALLDPNRLLTFRPRWYDLPALAWCVTPFFASITAGTGWYEGLSWALSQTILWGLPYLIGRMYFRDLEGLRELAVGVVAAAMIYAPLTIFEMRMAPQLHHMVYGTGSRGGRSYPMLTPLNWRPEVFMGQGFMVTMFMAMAALVAFWLWRTRARRQLLGVPMGPVAAGLIPTAILCKMWSGNVLMLMGLGVLLLTWMKPARAFAVCLVLLPPVYMVTRATGMWDGRNVVNLVSEVSPTRAGSFRVRLEHEDMLVERALERPVLGWGRMGSRWRIRDERGRDITRSDGLWVIAMGQMGLVGVTGLTLALLLPTGLFIWRYPARTWLHPAVAPAAVLALLPALHMVDNLPNAFPNPLFMLAAGGVISLPGLPAARGPGRRAAIPGRAQPRVIPMPQPALGGDRAPVHPSATSRAGRS